MSSTISTIVHTIWAWLPDLAVGLQFTTTLIGFYLTVILMIQRLRHRSSHRPSHTQEESRRPASSDRLVSVLSEDQAAAIGAVLRAAIEASRTDEQAHRPAQWWRADPDSTRLASEPVRTFDSAGTLSAKPNPAKRVEEIPRTERSTAA
ncbi:MAG: hypothetical protein ACRDSR_05635 [Pseudonocardiaceae bacterium]